ncbi:hypothetical protein A2U01_0063374, partial [Trifolium medium]|nr:hypothetical protein [Trifolium medium]
MATMDTKREVKPARSLAGKFIPKSPICFREVSCPSNAGFPESLLPPRTLPDVVKERPAISAATTEHDSAVSFNR